MKFLKLLLLGSILSSFNPMKIFAIDPVDEWIDVTQMDASQETPEIESVPNKPKDEDRLSPAHRYDKQFFENKDKINHEPIYPSTYRSHRPPTFTSERGEKLGYEPNTLTLKHVVFKFEDLSGNTGSEEDFVHLMEQLDANHVVKVGTNHIQTFFGHYYDLSGTGVFNIIVDENLIDIGSEAIVTDQEGYSKGYEFTQILDVLNAEQDRHYYDRYQLNELAYAGNNQDMLFLQYCRWDISYGLLKGNIAYRVW